MNVLRIIRSVHPRYGGPPVGIREMSAALAAAGWKTEVATLDSRDEPAAADFPVPVHPLGPGFCQDHYAPGLIPWLRRHVRRFDCAVIHGLWQFTSFGAWRVLKRSGVPYFVYPHGALDLYFRQQHPVKHLKKQIYWLLAEHRVLRDARAVLFTSELERQQARNTFRPYHCRTEVVGYGIRPPAGDHGPLFLNLFPGLKAVPYLVCLGRVHAKKGGEMILAALRRLKTSGAALHVVMAGPSENGHREKLTALAESMGVGAHITWTGMLPGRLKWGVLQAAEGLILPSHQENFGLSVIEALACGRPVLLSDKVNIARGIAAAGAGLVAPDTTAGVEALLKKWGKMSQTDRRKMGRAAGRHFKSHYDVHKAAARFRHIVSRAHGCEHPTVNQGGRP